MKILFAALLLVIPFAHALDLGPYPVTRVIDGDTFVVNLIGIDERVRLIGVDTPDMRLKQPGAQEATDFARAQLQGQQVMLTLGKQHRDRYGRLLAYVTVSGSDLSLELLSEGLGAPLTIPPNVDRADVYRAASAGARSVGKGIWDEAEFRDHNCRDFATRREAQAFFKAAGPGDPHKLDPDKDGRACVNPRR